MTSISVFSERPRCQILSLNCLGDLGIQRQGLENLLHSSFETVAEKRFLSTVLHGRLRQFDYSEMLVSNGASIRLASNSGQIMFNKRWTINGPVAYRLSDKTKPL